MLSPIVSESNGYNNNKPMSKRGTDTLQHFAPKSIAQSSKNLDGKSVINAPGGIVYAIISSATNLNEESPTHTLLN